MSVQQALIAQQQSFIVPSSGITFVDAASASDASGGNLEPGNPSGYQADDFALIFAFGNKIAVTPTYAITVATGWTELFQRENTGGTNRISAIWYKKLTGSESAPVLTNDEATDWGCVMACYRGVDTSTPFDETYDVGPHSNAGTNDNSPDSLSIDTNTDAAAVVTFCGILESELSAFGAPTGMTIPAGGSLVAQDRNVAVAHVLDAGTAGTKAYGNWNNTSSGGPTAENATHIAALKPA